MTTHIDEEKCPFPPAVIQHWIGWRVDADLALRDVADIWPGPSVHAEQDARN